MIISPVSQGSSPVIIMKRVDLPVPFRPTNPSRSPVPREKEAFIENYVDIWKVLNGGVMPYNVEKVSKLAERVFERNVNTKGFIRQFAAIGASGSRRSSLKSLTLPTLIIHGNQDPLLRYECGVDTHKSIPGSKFITLEDMGHVLHIDKWDEIIDAIAEHAV